MNNTKLETWKELFEAISLNSYGGTEESHEGLSLRTEIRTQDPLNKNQE